MTLAEYFTYSNVYYHTYSFEATRCVLYLFMHVLNINIFLLTFNVIMLKDFLVNKLLNIHQVACLLLCHLWCG